MLWHIGNTTVRTPYRLIDALRVLLNSPLNGNLSGREQENAFAALLHHEGVLDAPRVAAGQPASDLGRKWRSALSQLGFITPKLTRNIESGSIDPALSEFTQNIEGLTGRAYEITPNGHRLAQANIITAQQECFLRSLASYHIPSCVERHYDGDPFSPLRFTLSVIQEVSRLGGEPKLTFQEFALYVQTASPLTGALAAATNIMNFRRGREAARGNVRAYDRGLYEQVAAELDYEQGTLDDYADLTFRYLKATGVFRTSGRGITLSPTRSELARLLQSEQLEPMQDREYLQSLWVGAELPTDNEASAYAVVHDLTRNLHDRGEDTAPLPEGLVLADIEARRHELEARVMELDEEEYARDQVNQIDEIMAWIAAIPTRGRATLPSGESVKIPKGEGPAYLEWIVWRSFLAIDSLTNKPWESRRFQIDQDFLPVHCAPGGGPDMVFEFEDVIIVVEVTLTASSRQEAAEGEPVRRHVAQYAEASDKPVYGLFIAVQIDSNTAHTFRSGDWYLRNDNKITVDIVPLTLGDFGRFLASGKGRFAEMPALLSQLMMECRARANQDAPAWKQSINQIVARVSGD